MLSFNYCNNKMNWFKARSKPIPSPKSEDETNGLIFNDIPLLEELILIIFSYVDIKTIKKCRQVCKNWKDLVDSPHFWRKKLATKNKIIKERHPWYVYYICYQMIDKNLIKNGNGEYKLKYWTDIDDGGAGWKIENPPEGADELPQNQPEFNNQRSCFATSWGNCRKRQIIKLRKHPLLRKILDTYQPTILVSEWYAGRFHCGCIYKLGVRLYHKARDVLFEKEEKRTIQQFAGRSWEKVEIKCENYGPGVTAIEFYHGGVDTQYWEGHFGSKMAGGMVKILFDFV